MTPPKKKAQVKRTSGATASRRAPKKKPSTRGTKRPDTEPKAHSSIEPTRRARIEGLRQELFGDFLTAAEVAEILDVHPRTVGEYIRDGKLHGIQLGGGWRISEQALRAFVKSVAELPHEAIRGGAASMFSRFTDRARKVIILAQEEARLMKHNYIGTEHLLLGLLSEASGVGAKALTALGVSLETVRTDVESLIGTGSSTPAGHIPFTPRAKKVMELSLREALQLGHNYIGTEHLLLALLREGEGIAAQVLHSLKVQEDALRSEVLRLLASYTSREEKRKDLITKAVRGARKKKT